MNLSPFEMKTLLYHILSGKELVVTTDLMSDKPSPEHQISLVNIDLPKRVGIKKLSSAIRVSHCFLLSSTFSQPTTYKLTTFCKRTLEFSPVGFSSSIDAPM
ncbi:phosphorylase b kinase regulatory subunit alpha, liver isoform-like isoform X1 [Oculina patagonica]